MWMRWLLWLWCVYCCLCYMCVCWESVKVRGWRLCWCGGWMRCGCGESMACVWYTLFRYCASAADVLWVSVVRGMRGVGEVCEMCMCLVRGGVGGEVASGWEDWVWALPILCEQGECWTCVCLGCDGEGGVGGVGGE